MSLAKHTAQRGQAMTEFVVALLALLPIVLGVIYLGKYEDMKYSTVQASRYAAFERVFDPSAAHKSSTVLAEETRERFFVDPTLRNSGAVAFQDSSTGLQTAGTLAKNWFGTGSEPLVQNNYEGIQVTLNSSQASGAIAKVDSLVVDLNYKGSIQDPGIQKAQVQVPLVTPSIFSDLAGKNLTLSTATAVLADGYNSAGDGAAQSAAGNTTRGRVGRDWGLVLGAIPAVTSALQTLTNNQAVQTGWEALSDTPGPQFFCTSPDVVPASATSSGANYTDNGNSPACPNPQ